MFGNSKPIWNRHQLISTHSPERRLIFYLHAVYAVFCSNLYNVDKTWEWMLWHALTFPRTWSVSTVDMQWLRCAKMVRWSPGDTVHMVETAEMSRLDFVQTILSVLHDSYMTLTCLPDLTIPCQFCCGHETMVKQCTHPDQTSMSQFRTYILKTVYKLYHFIQIQPDMLQYYLVWRLYQILYERV